MNELKVFKNAEFGQIRGVEINGESWLVGKDVAERLGYTNPQKAIRDHVDEEDRTVNESFTVNGTQGVLINESGLYALVLGSKLPTAKKFKRWVTSDVLPAIRKHGGYLTQEKVEEALLNPDVLIKLATELKKEREERIAFQKKSEAQAVLITEMQPKASYYDKILQSKSTVSVTQIAKDYGMSAVKFNAILHDLKVQYKQGDMWMLYQKHTNKGYTKSKTFTVSDDVSKMGTYWTQNGRKFLYDLLKKNGILPECEQN